LSHKQSHNDYNNYNQQTKTMKSVTLLTTLMLGLCASAHATVYPSGLGGGVIQDGNLSGWSDTINFSDQDGLASGVQVHLNITGGYNGDLYAYLSHDGVLVPLLTRVGTAGLDTFGFDTSGMNITLKDGILLENIHGVASPDWLGTYAPDGRGLNIGTLQPDGASTTFASFDATDRNGDWTLFFADTSGGGGQSTIASWSVDFITAVPEPINVALGVFGGLFLVGSVCRSERVRKLFGKAAAVPAE
jgi:subtilisin-like proprotein convertase family protein